MPPLTADPVPGGTPWWLAVLLVTIPALGTVMVARAPVWLEKLKLRQKPSAEAAAAPSALPAGRADAALDLVEKALRDAWAERDAAQRRADRLQDELDAEQNKVARLRLEINELRVRCDTRGRGDDG